MTVRFFNQKQNMGFSTEGNPIPREGCIYPEQPLVETIKTCGTETIDVSILFHKTHGVTVPANISATKC